MSHPRVLQLSDLLRLKRCPHCQIATPTLKSVGSYISNPESSPQTKYRWSIYICASCGGAVIAKAMAENNNVVEMYPKGQYAQDIIPDRAREYLNQAIESKHAPAGAIMLCASSVDAMLKGCGYSEGSLYSRIEAAAANNLITDDMAAWAHEVRLDANDQRHSDLTQPLPSVEDASRVIDFTLALSDILFVLPERVRTGRRATESGNDD